MIQLLAINLKDPDQERVRRNLSDAIREQQQLIMASAQVLSASLVDTKRTAIAHGLGRRPLFVTTSCVRGAASTGHIEEMRDGSEDRSKYVVLKATGWGATINVDVLVL